jgi:hypothetical protein
VPLQAQHLSIVTAGDPSGLACALAGLPCDAAPGACGIAAPACGATGDVDLYARHASGLPDALTFDCASATAGSLEACTFDTTVAQAVGAGADLPVALLPGPEPGKEFLGVRGTRGPATYAIVALLAGTGTAPAAA